MGLAPTGKRRLCTAHAINSLCGRNQTPDRVVRGSGELKAPIFMGIFGFLWYRRDDHESLRRETLIITLLAVPLSLVLNRAVSTLVPFRDRPVYGVGGNSPSVDYPIDLENWSSFASDHATFMFAIAAGFWLISKQWGLLFGLVGAIVALGRVFVGIHYPSDILAGALIGIGTTLTLDRELVRKRIAAPLLGLKSRYPSYFYGLLFLGLAELSVGFPNTRRIAVVTVDFFTGHHKQPKKLYFPASPIGPNGATRE